jgi:two-component system OmpR family sensor kinase
MSLRRRLLVGCAVVLTTLVIANAVVVRSEAQHLRDQLDRELTNALPVAAGMPAGIPRLEGAPELEDALSRLTTSDVTIGLIDEDGAVTPLISSAGSGATPTQIDEQSLAALDIGPFPDHAIVDLSEPGTPRLRAAVTRLGDGDGWAFVARPAAVVDDAVARLRVQLSLMSAAILLSLALLGWWITRLGLRPIAEVTQAAEAISSGERKHRVALADERTEAGRLGQAFNRMLDERDATDTRLRQLVADASHELRTPLTSIMGYLELYGEGGFGDQQRLDDMVRRVSRESARMNDLVNDLLLLASLDQGRPLAEDPVDLGAVVRDAADDGRAVQPKRRIDVHLPGDEQVEVIGDEVRLRQVVAGLVHNALVHTPVQADIVIGAERQNGLVVLFVSDEGPGLTAAEAGRAFDRFTRGDPARTRHAGSSGLGLAITRSIVEAHHGSISLETAPGAGCVFRVVLPADPTSAQPDQQGG